MKKFFGFLNLLLCLELIVGPVAGQHGALLISSAMATDCPSGTQYDSTLNRCITSEQTAAVMNAVSNCNGDKECYKRNAEQGIKDAEAQGKVQVDLANKGGLLGSGLGIAAIALPLVIVIKTLATPAAKCHAMSGYLMLGAGVAAFAGEMMANSGHKSRLKKIQADWDKVLSTSTDSTKTTTTTGTTKAMASEAQSQAFEMLARSEDSLASAAKMKTMTYGVAAAVFAGAAVVAGMEHFSLSPTEKVPCVTPPTPPVVTSANGEFDKYYIQGIIQSSNLASFATMYSYDPESRSSPSIDSYEENKKIFEGFDVSNDYLQELKKAAITAYYNLMPISNASALAPVAAAAVTKAVPAKGFLTNSTTRMVASGLFAVWSGMMAMHAMNQAKIAKSRAELLRKMKDEFNDASTAINSCNGTDRENPAKPSCYCYTDAGQRNTSRTSSDVCIALFTGKNVDGTAGNYLASSGSAPASCITSAGNEDTSCACRASNTCLKTSVSGISGLDTGTFSLLNGAAAGITAVGNGTAGSAGVSGAGSVANAVRLLDANNRKLASTAAGQKLLASKAKLSEDLSNSLKASAAGQSNPFASSDSSGLKGLTPSQAVAALQNEFKKADSGITGASGGQTLAAPSSPGAPADQMELGFGTENPAETTTQVAEAMKQDLDFGNNDIKGSDTNIFEVVSSRYQRSGMRRLFDVEGKTKADAAAKDEIRP